MRFLKNKPFAGAYLSRKVRTKTPTFPALLVAFTVLLVGCSNEKAGSLKRFQGSVSNNEPNQTERTGLVGKVEKPTARKTGNSVTIPYEKYKLDNGLTIVLHEDHSDPLVHIDVTYHVGSSREEVGKSGFAHLFEHMMFNGSKNVVDEEHFKLVNEAGGSANGGTNKDSTSYFQTVPKNHLERMLWLEADRMGFLLPAITETKFELQRATVKNERREKVDNKPYGRLTEQVDQSLYPEEHPYSWPVIGHMEDIDRVKLEDLQGFFLNWYGPNNATLTIGGDFDKTETLDWVEKYFGSIPSGPKVKKIKAPDITLEEDRFISMEDNVSLPMIHMAYPTVHALHEDEAPLDVLMSVIGEGETSLLYKNLVNSGDAFEAQAGHACQQLACKFSVSAVPNPAKGVSLTDLEGLILETFDEFEKNGVKDEELESVKASIISSLIYGLESVSGRVRQLAFFETLYDDPGLVSQNFGRYEAVTKADVMRVYKRYIKGMPAVISSVVPNGQLELVAAPDNWKKPTRTLPLDASSISMVDKIRIPNDKFDRSKKPEIGERPSINTPEIWRDNTLNNIPIVGIVNRETPITTLQFRIKSGQRDEHLKQLGLANLTAAMLNQATQKSSNEELGLRMRKLGSQISISSGFDYTTVTIRTMSKNIDASLDIALEMLFEPRFSPEDFTRLKSQMIQKMRQSRDISSSVANSALQRLLYGDESILAYSWDGLEETVASLTLNDVKTFYEEKILLAPAELIVVSDIPPASLLVKLKKLSSWNAVEKPDLKVDAFPQLKTGTLYFIQSQNAAQSEIRIAKRAMPVDTTGPYFKAKLINYPLGGNFNSRINQNLRENKGYTYGAQSGFAASKYGGVFIASASVRADASAASIQEFIHEISAFAEQGMTEVEFKYTINAVLQSEALSYETSAAKLDFLSTLLTLNVAPSYTSEQNNILETITLNEMNELARKYLNIDEMIFMVVGDKETVLPQLQSLGMPIVELDVNGKIGE